MRPELVLLVAVIAGAGLMAGCLDGGEQLEPTSADDVEPDQDPEADDSDAGTAEEGSDDSSQASEEDGEDGSDADADDGGSSAGEENGTDEAGSGAGDEGADLLEPMATVAHIDTGINPYHQIFREDSELAYTHPSEYIDGYPEDAEALNLTLDADSWEAAVEADSDVWNNVTEGELYWVPGTRIVGAITFGNGGTFCPPVETAPGSYASDPTGGEGHRCEEMPILDDHGHGTMTASRMAGEGTSLCPDCRIVSIEGLGSENVRWAADEGWIDVQTNSWGSLTPSPANGVLSENFADDIDAAAEDHLVYFGSGNGFGGFFGFTPWPTHVQPTLREDVVWVGAHDNGKVAHWQGTPPHVVADGYRGLAAAPDTLEGTDATPFACCTSAASPYAAGLGARIVQEARATLDDPGFGAEDGVFAEGDASDIADGPLKDGDLTLDELRTFVKHTAEPRPTEGRHDGDTHWTGEASADDALGESTPWGPAGNPYCPGCVTAPMDWTELPSDVPAYPIIGYGGATPAALQDALTILEGLAAEPDRSDVDEYFATQQPVRETVQDPAP